MDPPSRQLMVMSISHVVVLIIFGIKRLREREKSV